MTVLSESCIERALRTPRGASSFPDEEPSGEAAKPHVHSARRAKVLAFAALNRSPAWLFGKGALSVALLSGCAFSHPDPLNQARMLVDKGRPGEAASVLEARLRRAPQAIAERRLLIRVYASMGQMAHARAEAQALAQALGPGSPIPWIELGYALEFSHRYDEAIEQYDRAAQVAPRDPLGPITGGLRAARWGEAELAEPRLTEGLRRDARNAEAWHALGLVRARLGNLDGASSAYRSGLRADPRAVEDHIGLATVAILRGDPAAALSEYDAVVSARPNFADAELGRSWALMKLGRLDDAQQALARAEALGASLRALGAQRRALAELRLRSGH
jgi:tetratricopeptide (TPR) repeat protein